MKTRLTLPKLDCCGQRHFHNEWISKVCVQVGKRMENSCCARTGDTVGCKVGSFITKKTRETLDKDENMPLPSKDYY